MAATLTCAHCGGDLETGDRYCPQCGGESLACASCSRPLLASDLSCPHCGTPAEPTVLIDLFATLGDDSSPMADILGRLRRATLGEFEIGRELGRGGMAAVFLAHEIALDRQVAIKVMAPGLLLGEGMVERFRHEAITIAHLHHPNIVSVYSVRQAEGLHYFVMRYVPGRSLEQVIQAAGRLSLPTVRSLIHQVGSALQYAHRSQVIHRDIKPANILIDSEGNAVVTDFGIAKAAARPSHTLTGALVGTPAYMSPEQCSGTEVSEASDQYALGAVAYELVTGAPPFAGSTLTVMQAHVERTPPPIRALRADCPPEVEAAILRMLAKDPAERWPRLADALAALGAAPLAEDDPSRAELIAHVLAGGDTLLMDTPPTSPAPRTRASQAGSSAARPIGGISIMPAPAGLETGDSFSLVAVIRGEHGTRLPPRAVTWTTDAPGVLRIDPDGGLATAVGPGTAMVTATCKGITALLRVEVATPRADDIVIEPMNEPLHVGEEIRLEATPHDKRGWPVYRTVTWHSADTEIAAVTPQGAIAGRAPGTVRITAALDDARASIVIPVLPARVASVDIADPPTSVVVGRSFALIARALDGSNNPLPGRALVWSSSDVNVAVVTGEGHVAALRPGSVVLTAMCEGARASVRIAVAAERAASPVEPTLRPPSRRRARRTRHRAVLLGASAVAAGVLWSVLRPGPNEVGSAASSDTTRPAAYAGPPAGVDTAPVPTVTIAPRPTRALRPEAATRLTAEVRDAGGRVIEGAAVAWSSTDSTVARVDRATGRVVALSPGRAQIVAANGAGRDSVVITVRRPGVRAPAVAAITIDAPRPIRTGDSTWLHAVALGPQDDILTGAEITWASSNPQVATVDAITGLTHGHTPGTAMLLARSGDQSSVAELTVLPNAVAAMQVLGGRPMAVQESLALHVVARDPAGRELTGIPVLWTSSDSTVAEVEESTGTVVGRARGSARITARADETSASILLTVLPRPEPLGSQGPRVDLDRAADWMETGLDECYGALESHNLGRLRAVWQPRSPGDEENLKRLSAILGSSEANATVGERIDRAPAIGPEAATMDFSVPLTWRESAGGTRTSQLLFRAEFVRAAGRWEMSSCRIVGTPRL